MPLKPQPTDPQDQAAAGSGLTPDQTRISAAVIRGIGRTERPAYRGGNGYGRLPEDTKENEDAIDAWHDGYASLTESAVRPDADALAQAFDEGLAQAARDKRRVRIAMPPRPEGYFHARPEVA